MPSSQSKLLYYIDENLHKGILFLADYWNQLNEESLSTVFDRMYWMMHSSDQNDQEQEDDEEDYTMSPPLPLQRLVIKGHIAGHVLTKVVTFLVQVQPPILFLTMTDSLSPFWLLPGLLRMLPNLQTLVLRDPVVMDTTTTTGGSNYNDDTTELWNQIHTILPTMKHLQCIQITWNNENAVVNCIKHHCQDENIHTDNDEEEASSSLPSSLHLCQALELMPNLVEFRQEGPSPVSSHQWTTTHVLHLFRHSTLECLRLACPLRHSGTLPSSHNNDCNMDSVVAVAVSLPPLPALRSTVLHVQLPYISTTTRDWLYLHVPVCSLLFVCD
jgi:hypothetical protein